MATIRHTMHQLPKGAMLTAQIHLAAPLRWRLWLGMWLIEIAAIVMGCAVNIDTMTTTSEGE